MIESGWGDFQEIEKQVWMPRKLTESSAKRDRCCMDLLTVELSSISGDKTNQVIR